ncbi:MAG TPA: NAD(P)-dependent oxidoreductase [Gaiellaceae bacterium]|jgi:nucleoside-diphosphate-sugar epimerase
MRILVLGAGYVGARAGELALADGHEVVLADNWYATKREQLAGLEAAGARVETADIRRREDVERLLDGRPDRLLLLAAQASRPVSVREPVYTEETNATGVRVVAECLAVRGGPPTVFGSSMHVYGTGLEGEVGADRPYGAQDDLAHLTKIYGELVLDLHARRAGFDLSLARLGIVYGPSPAEHDRPDSQTVVDKFRRLVSVGMEPELDGGGRATIGVVHVDDAARILLEAPAGAANLAAETITVADVARLARGEGREDEPAFTVSSPFEYRHRVEEYLRG